MTKDFISIVIPVYNEQGNVNAFHKELTKALLSTKKAYEVIYVDDRSTDRTTPLLKKIAKLDSHVRTFIKQGNKGKAFSLMEGFAYAKGNIFVMIDGDLQYPPAAIPGMIAQLKEHNIIVAKRKNYKDSSVRKLFSNTFRFIFGQLLFGLKTDIQSGLKVFTREVYETVKFDPISAWTFDLEFLHRARQAGYSIGEYDITFAERLHGQSKISAIRAIPEIGLNALYVRAKQIKPLVIHPQAKKSMRGAGIGYKKKRYITHTTLPFGMTALQTFTPSQVLFVFALLSLFAGSMIATPLATLQVTAAALSILYFIDTVFNLDLVSRSLRNPKEMHISDTQLSKLDDATLPMYSILCPLYKEVHVIPQFVAAIEQLDWPKEKLDVMLLLEEDDTDTIVAARQMNLPSYVRIVVVPDSQPKTKPKACNYGLAYARGEYLVIYDAEDVPDPKQLKKAYIAFKHVPEKVVCLQAKLNYYNTNQNLLTRFFTAEYSLWFDLTLTGLQSYNSAIPLGGTSNHFRIEKLRELQGWDPFNVTEDADLGVRLFQHGYRTAIVDSTTYEEATSVVKNWLRQRSRWIKGYMQTYLVHMRRPGTFVKQNGLFHQFIFQLTVGGKLLFILLNPVMWVITFGYFATNQYVGSFIEAVYAPPISYLAVLSWIFGNFFFLYLYMIACAKRQQWELMKYVFLIPVYWLLMSIAGSVAFYQLLLKPHYWEKTLHGFHLPGRDGDNDPEQPSESSLPQPIPAQIFGQPAYAMVGEKFGSQSAQRKRKSQFSAIAKKVLLMGMPLLVLVSLDSLLVKHYLPATFSQTYIVLSLFGKTQFVLSLLAGYSIAFVFMRNVKQDKTFEKLFLSTFAFSWLGYGVIAADKLNHGHYLFSSVLQPILPYLPFYTFAFMCFALSYVLASYQLSKGMFAFASISLVVSILQIVFAYYHHETMYDFVKALGYLGGADLILMFFLLLNEDIVQAIENNTRSFFGLWKHISRRKLQEEKNMRILVFNWRDTKHVYGGGAEVYVHELAKRWVKEGNKVTVFCGNDNHNKQNEVIDGVEIVRRGGTYTVYLFAFIYYMLKFRGKYDVIIDCENGIPFFTPLYVRKPVILLIHHVHQEVFRTFLKTPLRQIAALLEGKIMPMVYQDNNVITVSESSRKEINKIGFVDKENISIVHNGISATDYQPSEKTAFPSFLYLGRLKEYKQVDVAIKAFAHVVKSRKDALLTIAGSGEMYPQLEELTKQLGIANHVRFLGKVTESEKAWLYAQSWVVLQPSQIEGWGITVIEANAAGTPVIASRVNGLQDSVMDGQTGMLVTAGNVTQFAKAMKTLMTDAAYRTTLSDNALVWSRNFNWDKSAEDFYNIILASIEEQRGKPSFAEILLPSK